MRGYLVQPAGHGAVPRGAGDPREPRPQPLHRGRGAARRARKASSRWRRTDCRRSAAIPATTTRAARCRRSLDQAKLRTDMVNSARFLKAHALSTGKLGVTGFCWGGGTTNDLAIALGADLKAGVPFYGAAAETARVPEDQGGAAHPVRARPTSASTPCGRRIEAALKAAGVRYEMHMYPEHPARLSQQLDAALSGGGGEARLGAHHRSLQGALGLRAPSPQLKKHGEREIFTAPRATRWRPSGRAGPRAPGSP